MIKKFSMWIKQQFTRIRTKLFFTYFVLIIISISLVGVSSSFYAERFITEKAEQANQLLLNQIQINLDAKFEQIKSLLLSPYYDSEIISNVNRYSAMTNTEKFRFIRDFSDFLLKGVYVSHKSDYKGFQIFHSSEGLLYSTPGTIKNNLTTSYQTSQWFKKTVESPGKVYISNPYPSDEDNVDEYLYSASIIVRDYPGYDDEFGIFRIEYDFNEIETLINNTNLSEDSEVVILDSNFKLISGNDAFNNESFKDMVSYIKQKKDSFWYQNNTNDFLVSYTKLKELDWIVLSLTPRASLLEPSYLIRKITIITALLAFLITGIISYFFSKRITSPILHLYNSLSQAYNNQTGKRFLNNKQNEIEYIAASVNEMIQETSRLEKSKYTYEIKLREAELSNLYSQINPHFIYNTLDTIRAMADHYSVEDISKMTHSLADMLRYSTKNKTENVKVSEEVQHVKSYLLIQSLRFGDKIDFEVRTNHLVLHETILKMTLQPLIENAFFHGLERKKGKGKLLLSIDSDSEYIYIEIMDDGLGIEEQKLQNMKVDFNRIRESLDTSQIETLGIGISNVFARYVICYGNDFDFILLSKVNEGTRIQLKIPKVKSKNFEH